MLCPNYSKCKGNGNNKHKTHYCLANCPLTINNGESTIKRNDNVRLEEIRELNHKLEQQKIYVKNADVQLEQSDIKLIELEKQNQDLKNSNLQLKKNLEYYTSKSKKLDIELDTLQYEYRSSKSINKKVQEVNEKLKIELSKTREGLKKNVEITKTIQLSLECKLQDIDQLNDKLTIKDSELNSTKENLETTKQRLNSLNVENDQAIEMHSRGTVNTTIDNMDQNKTELKKKNKRFQIENKALEICLGYLYDDLTVLKNINKQQRAKNETLRNNLKAKTKEDLKEINNMAIQTSDDLEHEHLFGVLLAILIYITIFVIFFLTMRNIIHYFIF